jgi:hypothetical protein
MALSIWIGHLITAIGLGANRPQDAVYPTGEKDADGNEFDGASKKYVVHIDKGQMPPVEGFWSFTMYDAAYFFVPNTLNRYTLSSRNKFVTNPDNRWLSTTNLRRKGRIIFDLHSKRVRLNISEP